jgi:hypothetical protein
MKEIKGYECECCNYQTFDESNAKRHNDQCLYRPDNKGCLTCEFWVEKLCEKEFMVTSIARIQCALHKLKKLQGELP